MLRISIIVKFELCCITTTTQWQTASNKTRLRIRMTIRKGNINDLDNLQKLFIDTITEVCKKDYNSKQISVWTASVENKKRWQDILTNQFVLVAEQESQIVGFATLDKGNYLDLLYVHKEYQRQGIALKLYTDIENEARRQGRTGLTSDVSKTARPFFESIGFEVVTEQIVVRQNIELTNFKMTKEWIKQ